MVLSVPVTAPSSQWPPVLEMAAPQSPQSPATAVSAVPLTVVTPTVTVVLLAVAVPVVKPETPVWAVFAAVLVAVAVGLFGWAVLQVNEGLFFCLIF